MYHQKHQEETHFGPNHTATPLALTSSYGAHGDSILFFRKWRLDEHPQFNITKKKSSLFIEDIAAACHLFVQSLSQQEALKTH